MRSLLSVSAILEVAVGLGLLAAPSLVMELLLGSRLIGDGLPLLRVAGMALFALGIACWLAKPPAREVVTAMALYNFGAALILALTGLQAQTIGFLLWPVVVVHAAMGFWCVVKRNVIKD